MECKNISFDFTSLLKWPWCLSWGLHISTVIYASATRGQFANADRGNVIIKVVMRKKKTVVRIITNSELVRFHCIYHIYVCVCGWVGWWGVWVCVLIIAFLSSNWVHVERFANGFKVDWTVITISELALEQQRRFSLPKLVLKCKKKKTSRALVR
jgi:hypothetical protein